MINHVSFQGRFTKDLELKHTANDVAYVKFTLAWSEKYGEKENKCFLNCAAYKHNADFLSKYFHKGDKVLVEGRLITSNYETQKDKKWITELIVDKVHFCGQKHNGKLDDDETVLPF